MSETHPKAELRPVMRARLAALSPATRRQASTLVCARLEAEEFWQRARSVLLYVPLSDEIDLWPLTASALAAGKRVFLPAFDAASGVYLAREVLDPATDLVRGRFGIIEPRPENPATTAMTLDLVVVPGLAFDPCGWRLGRGNGYYDRLLASASAVTCGVAFDEQLVAAVPVEPHDVQLSFVLTPTSRHSGRAAPA